MGVFPVARKGQEAPEKETSKTLLWQGIHCPHQSRTESARDNAEWSGVEWCVSV